MLTSEQIARLIVDAYNMGKKDGIEEGYNRGYDDAMQEDEDEDEAGFDPEEYACKCSSCTNPKEYDMGWEDGFTQADIDPDMKDNGAYMDGFLQGREDRENSTEEEPV